MWGGILLTIAAIVLLLKNRRFRWIYIFSKTFRRDFRVIHSYIRLNLKMRYLQKHNRTVAMELSSIAKRYPQKVAIYFEDERWTFAQVDRFTNKLARYFKEQGFKRGDSIALLLENIPEYACIWLGLSKIGVATALINTNLVKESLIYSINIANCKVFIFGTNHARPVQDILNKLNHVKTYQLEETAKVAKNVLPNCTDLRQKLDGVTDDPLVTETNLSIYDPLLYIYTSGTTGMPKAAIVTNLRYLFQTWGIYIGASLRKDDVLYVALPLYHAAGNILALGQTIVHGISLVLRKKFSASNYWSDCEKYKCTVAQYIGEMCRYILAAPYKEPVKHSVRAILGNGLKPQIWNKFVQKFNIKQVIEYYGSTEGIASLINIDNTPCSVGLVPRYLIYFYPVTLIRCDEMTGEPIRDKNGYCTECGVNEAGLIIGKVNQRTTVFNFKGYCDEKETEKKLLHSVFSDGDRYFNSGDILEYDEFGNFFFKDRTGDTYRWKGENISTSEVESIISNITQFSDVVVFGVEITETDGKAGMAAIADPYGALNLELLTQGLKSNLPSYSLPMFIWVLKSVPVTGTFKLKKYNLRMEGYDINKIQDVVYYYNIKQEEYIPITKKIYHEIISGKVRF